MSNRELRLEVILKAIDRASGPLKNIVGSSSAAARAAKAASDELRNLQRQQRDIGTFKELQSGLQGTSERLNAAQQHLREMKAKLRAGGGDADKFRRDFTKANEAVRDLTQRLQDQRKALAPHAQKLREAGVNIARLGAYESELKDKTAAATDALQRQRKTLEAVGVASSRYAKAMAARDAMAGTGLRLGATGAAIGGAMSVPIRAYSEAEDAATQLRVAMMKTGGQVAAEYMRINELAIQLGDKLPGTTADFQNMMTMLIRQGMAPKAILGGLGEATAYLGVQLKMSSEEAAEFASKLQDATRTAEGDMMALMDVIQRSFYVGVDKGNMLNAFAKLAPALDTIRMKGLAGAKALAPIVAMADQSGMRGEASGNALRKVLQRSMSTEYLKILTDGLKLSKGIDLKLDFTDGKGEFGGLDQMFQQLGQLKSLNTENRLALIKDIYGDDAEVTQIVSLLIEKGKSGYEEMLQKMADQAAIQDRVNAQLGTLKNLWEAATGTFSNFMVAVGESIAPELKALTTWLGDVASAARQFAVEHPALTSGIMKTVGAIGLLTAGLGAALLGLAAIAGPFALVRYSFAVANIMSGGLAAKLLALARTALPAIGSGLLWLGRLFLANPIGLAVTAIGGAVYLIYRYWTPITAWFASKWASVKAAFSGGIADISALIINWSPLGLFWRAFAGVLNWFGTELPATFTGFGGMLIDGLTEGIRSKWNAVQAAVKDIGANLTGWFRSDQEIRSPSRVWAELGAHTMAGLAQGILQAQGRPLSAITQTAARLTAAGSIGLAGAGVAFASPAEMGISFDNRPPVSTRASGTAAPMHVNYTININASAGTDERALRALFRDELERHKRELEARARSRLADDD